jgi:hypothetical protein
MSYHLIGQAKELIAIRLIAAGNDPRPVAVIDAVVRIQAACNLICSTADDQVGRAGHEALANDRSNCTRQRRRFVRHK